MAQDTEQNIVNGSSRSRSLMKALRYFWFLLALGLLFWLLNRIGWGVIGDAFVRVGWLGAGILLAMGLMESLLDATALKAAVGHKIPLFRMLTYSTAGAMINVVIPMEAGEVVKGTLMKRHMTFQDAISGTILWNYLFKLTRPAAALLAIVVALALGHDADEYAALVVLVASVLGFLPYLLFRLLIAKGVAGLTVRLVRLLRIIRKDPDKVIESAKDLDTKIQRFRQECPGDYFRVLAYGFLARVVNWLTWAAAIWLVGLDYSFGLCALIYAGISAANYVVMLLPARIGLAEGAVYLLFEFFGLDGGLGLVASVIMRVKGLIVNGGASLFTLTQFKKRDESK